MAIQAGFGKQKDVSGKAVTAKTSVVPLSFLQSVKKLPIPVTISGTSQRTFTVNASKTNPVTLWNGNDFIQLKESLAYAWTGASDSLLGATGAETTSNGPGSTAPYYYYVGMNSSGTIRILPSLSAPSYVEGPFENGVLTHPGTVRGQYWNYVGFSVCTTASTAMVFLAATKVGHSYEFAPVTVATTTAVAVQELDFSATLPKHNVAVGGYLQTIALNQLIEVHSSSVASVGGTGHESTSLAILSSRSPFTGIEANSDGKLWATLTGQSSTVVATVGVGRVTDLV